MIIAIDVDNVLANLQMTVTEMFNNQYGTNYDINDFHDYNVENVLPLQEAIAMKKLYGDNDIYNHVKPILGSQDGVKQLITSGHEVYFVTDAITSSMLCFFTSLPDMGEIVLPILPKSNLR